SPCRRVLELACGTGTHALALERLGYDVVATDASQDMLAVARHKGQACGSSVQFARQAMRTLEVTGGPFDAVPSLFAPIGYAAPARSEHPSPALQGVRPHLRPGGLFVFEFWHAAAMLRRFEPVRVRRWDTPQGEILRLAETTLDPARQLGVVDYTIYWHRADG